MADPWHLIFTGSLAELTNLLSTGRFRTGGKNSTKLPSSYPKHPAGLKAPDLTVMLVQGILSLPDQQALRAEISAGWSWGVKWLLMVKKETTKQR